MSKHPCIQCGVEMFGSHSHRKYCSGKCKAAYRRANMLEFDGSHVCRVCENSFPVGPGENNKWLCSDECRKASNAKSVREFHLRKPLQDAIYRAKTRERVGPDGNQKRFYRNNPDAPRSCESCGESRVLEVAHKPDSWRLGERRSSANCKWPEKVWVLCPTCHRLLDRMNFSVEELGLKL